MVYFDSPAPVSVDLFLFQGNNISKLLLLLFSLAVQPIAGYGLLVTQGFLITHNDAPQSVGLLLDE
jgi:hypothetical protein